MKQELVAQWDTKYGPVRVIETTPGFVVHTHGSPYYDHGPTTKDQAIRYAELIAHALRGNALPPEGPVAREWTEEDA